MGLSGTAHYAVSSAAGLGVGRRHKFARVFGPLNFCRRLRFPNSITTARYVDMASLRRDALRFCYTNTKDSPTRDEGLMIPEAVIGKSCSRPSLRLVRLLALATITATAACREPIQPPPPHIGTLTGPCGAEVKVAQFPDLWHTAAYGVAYRVRNLGDCEVQLVCGSQVAPSLPPGQTTDMNCLLDPSASVVLRSTSKRAASLRAEWRDTGLDRPAETKGPPSAPLPILWNLADQNSAAAYRIKNIGGTDSEIACSGSPRSILKAGKEEEVRCLVQPASSLAVQCLDKSRECHIEFQALK